MKKGNALDSIFLLIVTLMAFTAAIIFNKVADETFDGLALAIPGNFTGYGTVNNTRDNVNAGYTSFISMLPLGLLASFGVTVFLAAKLGTFESIDAFMHFLLSPFVGLLMFVLVSVFALISSDSQFTEIINRNNLVAGLFNGMPMVLIGIAFFFIIFLVMFARSRESIG